MSEDRELQRQVEAKVKRIKEAEKARHTLLAEAVHIGTLGLLFILPVIGGAYLGSWLDSRLEGYAVHWTVSLIVLGVIVGALNVSLHLRD